MTKKFSMVRDINGYNGFGLSFSDAAYSGVLATNTEDTITVPNDQENYIAIMSFTPGSNIWVSLNDTAAVPGGGFAASTSELNPTARQVKAGDVLSFITSDTTSPNVGVTFYVISPYTN